MTVATNISGTFSAKNSRSTSSFEPLEGRTMFAAGSIDSLFGTNGTVVRNIFNSDDYGFAVAVQSDGKVLVAGRASNGVCDIAGCSSELGGEVIGGNPVLLHELRHRPCGWTGGQRVVVFHAVQEEVRRRSSLSVHRQSQSSRSAGV